LNALLEDLRRQRVRLRIKDEEDREKVILLLTGKECIIYDDEIFAPDIPY
jgi:hypothetical protein